MCACIVCKHNFLFSLEEGVGEIGRGQMLHALAEGGDAENTDLVMCVTISLEEDVLENASCRLGERQRMVSK